MVTEVVYGKDGAQSVHGNGHKSIRSWYYCLSTDTKPIEGVENADGLTEMDTCNSFYFDFDNKVWREM